MASLRKQLPYLGLKLTSALGLKYGRFGGLKIPVATQTWKYLFREIFLDQVYYFASLNKEPRILDCGSNVGFAALYFKALYPQAKVTCFEASRETFEKLKQTLNVNGVKDVRIEQVALSASDSSDVNFYRNSTDGDDLGSALHSMGAGSIEKVSTRRLSSYISDNIDYLKLDVEGAETEVLEDLVSTGKIQYLHQGSIEFHLNGQNPKNDLGKILSHLKEQGFSYRIRSCSIMGQPWRPTQAIVICFMREVNRGVKLDAERRPAATSFGGIRVGEDKTFSV